MWAWSLGDVTRGWDAGGRVGLGGEDALAANEPTASMSFGHTPVNKPLIEDF